MPAILLSRRLGLPPQVRGALGLCCGCSRPSGLTPAGAGSTWRALSGHKRKRAYPRRCGEHRDPIGLTTRRTGLPPQVRGAPIRKDGKPKGHGAYPRRCGEHLATDNLVPTIGGLPPQVRGAPWRVAHRLGCRRAYPRRCGEHPNDSAMSTIPEGLPPQVRGARPDHGTDRRCDRLTPAGAGSTHDRDAVSSQRWAYPRRCGEHGLAHVRGKCLWGLPPQVRGALRPRRDSDRDHGLTPAGAGSTGTSSDPAPCNGAYPRRCGEHPDTEGKPNNILGLPPQVRGARRDRRQRNAVHRLTPAGAGSTRSAAARAGV